MIDAAKNQVASLTMNRSSRVWIEENFKNAIEYSPPPQFPPSRILGFLFIPNDHVPDHFIICKNNAGEVIAVVDLRCELPEYLQHHLHESYSVNKRKAK